MGRDVVVANVDAQGVREVAALARAHGQGALCLTYLRACSASDDAAADLARLAEDQQRIAARGMVQQRALREVGATFARAGVPALALKGGAFVGWLYPSPETRPSEDLDFLIPPDAWRPATSALAAAGWTPAPQRVSARAPRGAQPFQARSGVVLDLHASFADAPGRAALDTEAVFERATYPDHLPPGIATLRLSDHIVHVCEHGARGGWVRLAWVEDLRRLLGALDEDQLPHLLDLVARLRRQRALAYGACAIQASAACVPEPLVLLTAALEDRRLQRLARALPARWAAPSHFNAHRSRLRDLAAWSDHAGDVWRAAGEQISRGLRRRLARRSEDVQ